MAPSKAVNILALILAPLYDRGKASQAKGWRCCTTSISGFEELECLIRCLHDHEQIVCAALCSSVKCTPLACAGEHLSQHPACWWCGIHSSTSSAASPVRVGGWRPATMAQGRASSSRYRCTFLRLASEWCCWAHGAVRFWCLLSITALMPDRLVTFTRIDRKAQAFVCDARLAEPGCMYENES